MQTFKRVLRGIGGLLLILLGVFCGAIVYSASGGLDGWRSFRIERMLEKNLIFAIGCPLALLLGVGVANTGSRANFYLGALFAFAATAMVLPTATNAEVHGTKLWLIGAGVLAIASAVAAALGRKPA